jgi:predicted NBD/HSP70 family sugar kinase
LGVSIAGIVDSQKLLVKYAPNLGWEDFDIGGMLKKYSPGIQNIAVGNDAKSSALAELWFGSHNVNLSNFVFISVGPGIGSGIVAEGNLLDGEFHASGEFGHMTILEDGVLCTCSNKGCWEAYASDRATVKRYIKKKHSKIKESVDVMVQDITDLANDGDEHAIKILKETGYYVGLGIVNVIKSVDPHAIIIGGRITNAWKIIYPEIIDVVRKRAFFGKEKNILILPTSLKVRPRLLGAATLAIKMIFDEYKVVA